MLPLRRSGNCFIASNEDVLSKRHAKADLRVNTRGVREQ
jgi:hypothetical protein